MRMRTWRCICPRAGAFCTNLKKKLKQIVQCEEPVNTGEMAWSRRALIERIPPYSKFDHATSKLLMSRPTRTSTCNHFMIMSEISSWNIRSLCYSRKMPSSKGTRKRSVDRGRERRRVRRRICRSVLLRSEALLARRGQHRLYRIWWMVSASASL